MKHFKRVAPVVAMAALFAVLLTGCDDGPRLTTDWSPEHKTRDGLSYVARAKGDDFVLTTKGGKVDFLAGVNLGATIPGSQPGEVLVGRDEFRRWLPQMAALGLHTVRIYTILPPSFYEELAAFNTANPTQSIYLIQGVWIPEERFLDTQDLFDPAVREGFRTEIADAVAAVHGRLERSETPGKASGHWTTDVGQWVCAYSLGVEWDPIATSASDAKNAGRPAYKGTYFSSKDNASPTETWLAEMLDLAATEEAASGRTMPLTFTNWPTTDPLTHPDEPLEREDLVGVDANHIKVSSEWPGGFFASYHAYPYYPDFQRHELALQETTYNGVTDPYAGYLRALREHHEDMPVMITEFGVPSSMGMAHAGPLGRHQGAHSEQDQMAINSELLRIIHHSGYSGACVFEWTDEWFKFTWNTIEYELPPNRRQLWVNPWTNEEHFGLLAMDPGASPAVIVDGNGQEWEANSSQVIFEGAAGLREVRAVKDEGYLYLRLVFDDPAVWTKQPITIGVDILPGGNGGLPGLAGEHPDADYAIVLGPGESGQAYVRASNDQYEVLWGKVAGFVPFDEQSLTEGSGVWNEQKLITNRPMTIPRTQESLETESFDVGKLLYGSTDPMSADFDCRSIWSAGDCIEMRLPYAAIGFADPSSLQALLVAPDGTLSTETVERLGISVAVGLTSYETNGYAWDPWQTVQWHERLKSGAAGFAAAVTEVTTR